MSDIALRLAERGRYTAIGMAAAQDRWVPSGPFAPSEGPPLGQVDVALLGKYFADQYEWLRWKGKSDQKWRPIRVTRDEKTGDLKPSGQGWTPDMRQEFGRVKGGLKSAGPRRRRDALEDDRLRARILELKAKAKAKNQQLGNRPIAERLGISESKVRRLLRQNASPLRQHAS